MICYVLFYIATHKTILFNLILNNRIRHRRTATIAINKAVAPKIMPVVILVEFISSDMLLSVNKPKKRKSKYLEFTIIAIILLNFTIPTNRATFIIKQ